MQFENENWKPVSVCAPFCHLGVFAHSLNVPCSDSWRDVRAFWCVWTALGTSQFPFPRSWDGGKSTHSNHCHDTQTCIWKGQWGMEKQRFERKFWEEKWQEVGMQQAGSWVSAGFKSCISKPGLQIWQVPEQGCCQKNQWGHLSPASAASFLLPGTNSRIPLANPASICLIECPYQWSWHSVAQTQDSYPGMFPHRGCD